MNKKQKNNPPQKNKNQPRTNHQQNQQQVIKAEQELFSGPMPPPEILRQYDEILPGSAERIMAMAEDESSHQKKMEKSAMDLKSRETRRGQYLAMATVIVAFSAATVCAYFGAQTAAVVIGGTTVVGLVAAFITGRTGISNK